ncbi:HAD-IIIA family hydrolase [Ginsengibacter hankyongi]|uniref:HAD-IIIA family hydrolase n=1 Tax=Ginsengibacter hankyongi TaxID=2607284 RepID=A0A5J5IC52_9BACT|nr:HAD-IIIA family hydrolase [Ginsengibacter hankyongi]KAA9036644.1 HAD-IIIA family hydrolase [Ginsengibacter hankyongi]
MIKQAIILAGGLGTRLRSVVSELPKCMAPVAGKPFLHYVIAHLQKEGIQDFIFSVGYKSESIISFVKENLPHNNFQFSIEDEPLGTGGALQLAIEKSTEKNILVCNGDTLFNVHVNELSNFHEQHNSDCTLCLKPMSNFDRYGVVELGDDNLIISFKEKQFYNKGLINGGVYALNTETFLNENLPEKFSFEKDYLEKFVSERKMYGLIQDEYFIDIGIPEDYERAQEELKIETSPQHPGEPGQALSKGAGTNLKNYPNAINLKNIDKTWTLFLDRDGVINDEKHEDYIHKWEEFKFYHGVKEALKIFTEKFGKIFIVTNQRGVAKGLTKLEDLELIHKNMIEEFEYAGGRIDKIYYSIDFESDSPNRKPNPGMGLQAQKDFPEIDFSKSVMIGNTLSDMKFGRNLNIAINIFLPTTRKEVDVNDADIDLVFDDLISVAKAL